MDSEVKNFLEKNNVEYTLHTHSPVYTCEEAEKLCGDIPGLPCKNLFLRDKKSKNFYLVIMPAEKRMDLKKFGKVTSSRITFARDEQLLDILGLTSGAVSPLGLINDKNNITKIYIDEDVWNADIVSFHPNVNTETIEISREVFRKLMELLGNGYENVSL